MIPKGKYKRTEEIIRKQKEKMYGRHSSLKTEFKSKNMEGKKHWNWKGGISPLNCRIRASKEYKLWRTTVFERDNYTCIFCKTRNGNGKKIILNADHIKPFCDYPKLRFAIDNGTTLCRECHNKITIFNHIKK